MRIAVNGIATRGGGAETFLRELLGALLEVRPEVHVSLLIAEERAEAYAHVAERCAISYAPRGVFASAASRLRFEIIALPLWIRRQQPDLYFRADELLGIGEAWAGSPTVITWHALQHLLIPELMPESRWQCAYQRGARWLAARLADRVVAVSDYEAGQLKRLFPNLEGRISVIKHGVSRRRFARPRELKKPGAVPAILLTVGDRHRHKNLPRLIRAWARIDWQERQGGILRIVGRRKSREEEQRIRDACTSADEGTVCLFDYASGENLLSHFEAATAYVTSSLFETFGLTPLEAMAAGLPVAAARIPPLEEVCGDAAVFFDPHDEVDMARAIESILFDEGVRDRLRAAGAKRVESFTWETAASSYWELFVRMAATCRGRGAEDRTGLK